MSREICPFLNMALKAAEQLSRLWRIIWKNALWALFEYSLRFGIIRQLFSSEMATHRCQSTAEGEHNGVMARKHTQKPHRMKKKKKKSEYCRCALFLCSVLITHNSRRHVLSALLSHFFSPPPPSLRALFKVILALHMAD